MKWSTANLKSPNYTENHEIYVGTSTGTFKRFVPAFEDNPFVQRNLYDINQLEKDDRVTALSFGNDTSEIFIGRAKESVHMHSLRSDTVERTIELKFAPVVGFARFDDYLAAGFSNGQVQRISISSSTDSELIISSGDDMSHLRQCPTNRNLVATGGKGRQNNLKVLDMAADGKQIFTSKNLPNDYLQLEVPVWDSDVGFIDSPHTLATCSRYGYVRLYDTRKQRRPVQCFATEEQMSFATLVAHGNYIYTGTTMGAMKAFDIRRMKTFVHTYKGFTGAISDVSLDSTGKYLASASLDRYVRVHHVDSTVLLYQCYVKSKATRVLIRQSAENPNSSTTEATEEDLDKTENSTKKKNIVKATVPEDKEYEDMFENMQTICDDDDVSDAEKEEEKSQKIGSKRKGDKNFNKSKKKKE
ncbi:WD repeat-containing protein 74 [Bactrocera neohumeralis]|uniref:WD repeat-containing protein 74 n=1 Tax=Bactrocera tryoni TaxID=59916 RepID=UPI001A979531|nr:WD repeat-containing protein 74 [Bactrocera tryoni]XP_050324401.1 WD repeat-containing protein 74 [Bactrocera neohumeralis]